MNLHSFLQARFSSSCYVMHSPALKNKVEVPLVVDIDGSLVSGDLLIEGTVRMISAHPLNLFALLLWLVIAIAKGRAALKRKIAQAVALPPETLVLNPAVTNEITTAKAAGREVWLASAADELVVAPLAEAVGAMGYFASDGRTNLAGRIKATVLVKRFGKGGFDYVGNERRDLAVWKQARHVIGVNLSASLARKLQALDQDAQFLDGLDGHPLDYLRAIRPHQWIKNVLVFLPLIAAQETSAELYLVALALFIALSACASGTYLLNDLFDLPYDRRHKTKRHRPIAAGKVPLLPAVGIGVAMMAGGLLVAFQLSAAAGLCILLYLIITFAYSLLLKRMTFIDVLTLSVLYTIRVIAGGMAVSIMLSPWFLGFFIFMFLALAIVKRQSELYTLRKPGESKLIGRAYFAEDLPVMAALGAASSFASIVILTLYIQSLEAGGNYDRLELLWLICPLLIYWLGRMMLLANRGIVDDDPLVFAMGDRASWLTGVGILAIFTAAL